MSANFEQQLIGCLLRRPDLVFECRVHPQDFVDPRMAGIWTAAKEGASTRAEIARRVGLTEREALDLSATVMSTEFFAHYAERVRNQGLTRQVKLAAERVISSSIEGADLLHLAQKELGGIHAEGEAEKKYLWQHGRDVLASIERLMNGQAGELHRTGFRAWDKLSGGLPGSAITIIGALPSTGKTALLACLLIRAMLSGHVVDFYTLEDSAVALTRRIFSQLTQMANTRFIAGNFTTPEFTELLDKLRPHLNENEKSPIICDTAPRRARELATLILRNAQRRGTKLVCLDYVQLCSANKKTASRVEELDEIITDLRAAALESGVAMIVASQLSRPGKGDEGKKASMQSLRGSGQIEAAANMIGILERPEWLGMTAAALLHIVKNKDGPTGTVVLGWNAPTLTFFDAGAALIDEVRRKDLTC